MIKGTKVLVIDDEEIIRKMINFMLTDKGCTVTVCKNGKEGIRCFRSENYDIVLTDRKMPEMSGLEVAKSIREIDSNIPIALVSSDIPDTDEAKRSGIDMFLAKPFTYKQLIDLVADPTLLRKLSFFSNSRRSEIIL